MPRKSVTNTKKLEVHLTEYETLRREIEFSLKAQQQLTNYSLVIVGAISSFYAFSSQTFTNAPYLFLISSIMLSAIILAMVDMGYGIQDVTLYLKKELFPQIWKELRLTETSKKVLGWEFWIFERRFRKLNIRALPALGKYIIGYTASLILVFQFWHYRNLLGGDWMWYEYVLVGLSLLLLFFLPTQAIIGLGRNLTQRKRKKK